MNAAQNRGSQVLQPGDVVVSSGISATHEGVGVPLFQVADACSASSAAVGGVVYQHLIIEALAENPPSGLEVTPDGARRIGPEESAGEDAPGFVEATCENPVQLGEYLLLVAQGRARVKVSALANPIQPGDLLSGAGQGGLRGSGRRIDRRGRQEHGAGQRLWQGAGTADCGTEADLRFCDLAVGAMP